MLKEKYNFNTLYYNADEFKFDTQKFWLQLTVDYSSTLTAVRRWWVR